MLQVGAPFFLPNFSPGSLEIKHIAIPPLKQEFLDEDDCHVLDIGTEIFVWIGKGCTKQEKESSMIYARKFLQDQNRPEWTPIERLRQGEGSISLKFTNRGRNGTFQSPIRYMDK